MTTLAGDDDTYKLYYDTGTAAPHVTQNMAVPTEWTALKGVPVRHGPWEEDGSVNWHDSVAASRVEPRA